LRSPAARRGGKVVQVLQQCRDNLTRHNVMKQAANLHDFTVPMLLPGITIKTIPIDFARIRQIQVARFDAGNGGYSVR
jgi:branched-chain amino acid transport system substrate-binding protein